VLKRLLLFFGLLAFLVIAAGLALPWWWGFALRALGADHGLRFGEYRAIGYGRWEITAAAVDLPDGGRVTAGRLSAPHPVAWWWLRSGAGEVRIDDWRVEFPTESAEGEAQEGSFTPADFAGVMVQLQVWLPPVSATSGQVWRDDGEVAVVPTLNWEKGQVHADIELPGLSALELESTWLPPEAEPGEARWQATVSSPGDGWEIHLRSGSLMWQGEIDARWRGQSMAGVVAWEPDSWVPHEMHFGATDVVLPAADLGWEDYYEHLQGSGRFKWADGSYDLELELQGAPRPSSVLGKAEVEVKARGDGAHTTVEALMVRLPGVDVALDEAVTWAHAELGSGVPSRFRAEVDFGRLPRFPATGRLAGDMLVTPQGEAWPTVEFDWRLADLTWREWKGVSGRVRGSVDWPGWEIHEADLADMTGGTLVFTGQGRGWVDSITGLTGNLELPGAALESWMPAGVRLAGIDAEFEVEGTPGDWRHRGSWTSGELSLPHIQPLEVEGTWTGEGATIHGETKGRAGAGFFEIKATYGPDELNLTALEVRHDGNLIMETTAPMVVRWGGELTVSGVELSGRNLRLALPIADRHAGEMALQLRDEDWTWLADWLEETVDLPRVETLDLDLAWTPDQVVGHGAGALQWDVGPDAPVEFKWTASASETGLAIERSALVWNDDVVARLSGTVPVTLRPRAPWWLAQREGAVDAQVSLARNPALWAMVAERYGVSVENASLDVRVSGTWDRPQGQGKVSVERIELPGRTSGDAPLSITDIEAVLVDDGEGLVADPVTARWEGQLMEFRGELPVAGEDWQAWLDEPWAYLRRSGRGRLRVPDADLAAVARFVPNYLVPAGHLEMDLTYAPAEGVQGTLQVRDASTRPLGPLGVLQEVQLALEFKGRTVDVREATALMGGQAVTLSGQADWPETGSVAVDLDLQGINLPLVRRSGVLLRSDLDLQVNSRRDGSGEVTGEARLRDGLVLMDLRALVPTGGGTDTPARRPPYFSVDVPILRDWRMDVRVIGDDFLRLRTPVMTGSASLDVQLAGTLGRPRSTGEIIFEDADIRLPFARLEIEEAFARLTETNPYDPEVFFQASGQRLGYDLQMELSGTVNAPRLSFYSSPTLTSEEFLMLVMAGVAPRDNADMVNEDRALRLGLYLGRGLLGDVFNTDGRERLSLSTGEQLSRLGKETYQFEYEFADRWNVVAEYDEFDYYNAALKWRVRPRRNPESPEQDSTEEADDE
jgi:translocation and assembly module TamB